MRNSETAKMAPFLMMRSPPRSLLGDRCAVLRVRHEDLNFLEPREIDGGFRFDLLIDAEDPLDDVRHFGDRYALWKAAAVTTGHEDIALLDFVRSLDVLDANDVT